MKILVSACLMGENCKYNGKNNKNQAVIDFVQGHEVVQVCPEQLAGLGTPRPCAEICKGRVMDQYGKDIDAAFRAGVAAAMERIRGQQIDLAILQSRSPTCGVKQIYDGTFSRKLVPGMGLLAEALTQSGIRVMDAEDVPTTR